MYSATPCSAASASPLALKGQEDYVLGMDGAKYYYADAQGIEVVVTQGQARRYPWHMHTRHWTVGVVRLGAALLTTAHARRRLGQGQQFCMAPYQAHSLQVEPHSAVVAVCFDAQGAALLRRAPDVLGRGLAGLAGAGLAEADLVAAGLAELDPALPFCRPEPAGNFSAHEGAASPEGGRALRDILQRILAMPHEPLGIARMAAHAGYSPWHFVRAFHTMTGMTPHAFQLLCRVRVARELLRADTAAATAAVSAGFADQSHMHKVFKRHHGLTPGQFKKASVRLAL